MSLTEKDIRPGRTITLTGFVATPPRAETRDFELARFYITCCVADAIPVGVTVTSRARFTAAAKRTIG
jgi:uncharacterized membrane protein YcgQ (UPF0703/DUF1980 family)